MKSFSLSSRFKIKNLSDRSKRSLPRMSFFTFAMSMLVFFLSAGTSMLNAQDQCDISKGWWQQGFKIKENGKTFPDGYLTLNSGIKNNDTIHLNSCQDPWSISATDLKFYDILNDRYCGNRLISRPTRSIGSCVKIKTFCYLVALPDNAPAGMYQLWKYQYVVDDVYCQRKYTKTYYLALYDHGAPIYQCFPNDTTVASAADMPPADKKVKVIDVCQYVAWDTIMMIPILNEDSSATVGYTRRWMARDPSGNESYKDQKIWFASSGHFASTGLQKVAYNSNRSVSELKVYPNPARNMVYIDLKTDVQLQYNVYDALGRSVKTGDFQQGQPIMLDKFGAGVYHVQLRDREEILGTKRVLLVE